MKLLYYTRRFKKIWSVLAIVGICFSLCAAKGDTLSKSLLSSPRVFKEDQKNDTFSTDLLSETQVPEGVQMVIDSYLKDSTYSAFSFAQIKELYHLDTLLKLSDIEAGVPVHEFVMDFNKFKQEKDTVPVTAVVKPIDSWQLPIPVNGKYLYLVTIAKSKGSFSVVGIGPVDENWGNASAFWSESSGYKPILIHYGSRDFFHFPQIDKYNLMTLRRYKDSVTVSFDESTGDNNPAYVSPVMKNSVFKTMKYPQGAYLSDSRKIFKYLKKEQQESEDRQKTIQQIHR